MPVINTEDGQSRWLSDDEYRRRLTELRSYGRPTTSQRSELVAFEEHERARTRIAALAGNSRSHMPGTDLGSGYSRAQERHRNGEPDTGPGDWSADPRLNSMMSRHPDVTVRRALESVERSHTRNQIPGWSAEVLDRGLRTGPEHERTALADYLVSTGSETYQRTLATLLCDPYGSAFLSDAERASVNAAREARQRVGGLLEGTPASWSPGSYPVPYQLDPTVILTSNGTVNPLRQIGRVEQIVGKEWLGITSDGVTVSRELEATEASDASPTLVQPGVAPTRVQAFVPFSVEVEQDWNGLMAEIAMMLADAKDIEEATSFLSGSGTAPQPAGIVTALAGGAQEITTAGTADVALADVTACEKAVAPRFRAGAQWVGSLDFALWGRTTERGITTKPVLADLPGDGGADLLGKPFSELSSLGTIASNDHVAIFGNWKQFLIVDRIASMSIELVPHLFGSSNRYPTGQRGIYASWRNSCQVLAPTGFAVLKVR